MWRHYLADIAGEAPVWATPARETDLRHLPPAYIMTARFDPLRDEAVDYGVRMLQAGISVELHNYPGTFHRSDVIGEGTQIAAIALAEHTRILSSWLT